MDKDPFFLLFILDKTGVDKTASAMSFSVGGTKKEHPPAMHSAMR
jgi:hypothetical protein